MIYKDFGDKLEVYSSDGKTVCTISTEGVNVREFEKLDLDDYDYKLEETYYPTFGERDIYGNLHREKYVDNKLRKMFKNKEEKEMNKVLELYYERRIKKLEEFYKELKEEEYNKLEVVKEFNKVVEEYNNKMQELMGKYRDKDEDTPLIYKTCYNEYPYVLSHGIKDKIYTPLRERYQEDKKALLEEKETIAAVLSLSEDKDYQVEVLKNYGILDKKGMMIEDDE